MKDNNQPADERCQQCGGFLTVPKDSTDAARILCGGLMLEEKKANLRSSLERIRLAESFPVENGDFVEKSSSGWRASRKVSIGKEGERHGIRLANQPASETDVESLAQTYARHIKYWWGSPNLNIAEEIRSALNKATEPLTTQLAELRRQKEAAEARVRELEESTSRIWDRCKVVYYPRDGSYPLEHNMSASKDMREAIYSAMAKEGK